MSCPYKTLPLQGGFAAGACGHSSARGLCAGIPPVPGGTPGCKPTPSTDISTNISADTHEERPFGGRSNGTASAHGPTAWSSPGPRTPAGALSTLQAPVKALGVLLCPYQSARAPAELGEDVPHHIPRPAALGTGAEQLPDELQDCHPHLPGETVVMILLFKTQREDAFAGGQPVWFTER